METHTVMWIQPQVTYSDLTEQWIPKNGALTKYALTQANIVVCKWTSPLPGRQHIHQYHQQKQIMNHHDNQNHNIRETISSSPSPSPTSANYDSSHQNHNYQGALLLHNQHLHPVQHDCRGLLVLFLDRSQFSQSLKSSEKQEVWWYFLKYCENISWRVCCWNGHWTSTIS